MSFGWLVIGRSVGRTTLKRCGRCTSMLLSEHLFFSLLLSHTSSGMEKEAEFPVSTEEIQILIEEMLALNLSRRGRV